MKFDGLIRQVRKILSEAEIADKEKAYERAKVCLLYAKVLIKDALRK